MSNFSSADSLLVLEGSEILGTAAIIRTAPMSASIGCFNVNKVAQREEISDLLVRSSVARAKETGHTFISCIPGRDQQPSSTILQKYGFSECETRDAFYGKASTSECHDVRIITDPALAAEVIAHIQPSRRTLNLYFRSVRLDDMTLNYALSRGSLIVHDQLTASGAAIVFESKCMQEGDSPMYLVPEYLANSNKLPGIQEAGEISLLAFDGITDVLFAALAWLADRGIKHTNVYTSRDGDVGFQLMARGFVPTGAQVVWAQDFKGPMDTFI